MTTQQPTPISEQLGQFLDELDPRIRKKFLSSLRELTDRQSEALCIYRPLKHCLPFHLCEASERLARGGNQCTSLDTQIPTSRGLLKAADVRVGDTVPGGTVTAAWLSDEPVPTWKICLEGGFELVGNAEHPVLTKEGWKRFSDLEVGDQVKLGVGEWVWSQSSMTPADGYFVGVMVGDGCLTGDYGVMKFTSADDHLLNYVDSYMHGATSLQQRDGNEAYELGFCNAALKEKMEHCWGVSMTTAHHKRVPLEVTKDREVARQFLRGYTDTDGCVHHGKGHKERSVIWVSASQKLLRDVQQLLLAFGVYSVLSRDDKQEFGKTYKQWRLRARGPWADVYMQDVGCGLDRKTAKYPPLRDTGLPTTKWVKVKAKVYCHRKFVVGLTIDPTNAYVTNGICSHNSSKTQTGSVEFASSVTKEPIRDCDGEPIPYQYERSRPWLFWVFGLGEDHLGGTIFRKLFMPGSFDLIRDRKTKELRAWQPWLEDDAKRVEECVPAPPLIPSRLLDPKGWSWANKAARVVEVCRTTYGDELRFFTSAGVCPQGATPNVIWIDENLGGSGEQITELRMRQGRVRGRLWWSAWPDAKNDALYRMVLRAKDQAHLAKPDIVDFCFTYSNNPFIPDDEKRRILSGMTEKERAARDRGEFTQAAIRVFPSFSADLHGLPGVRIKDAIHTLLEANHWRVPDDWTRYLVVDPGHTNPFAIGIAVSPPEIGYHVVQFCEVATPNLSAEEMGREIARVSGFCPWEAWVIDHRASRQTPMGNAPGDTVRSHYTRAFREADLTNAHDGVFSQGCDDINLRNIKVRQWLDVRRDGTPTYRILHHKCPETVKQFESYSQRVTKDWTSETTIERNNDAMACMGYAAAYNPKHVYREQPQQRRDPMYERFLKDCAPQKVTYGFDLNLTREPVATGESW